MPLLSKSVYHQTVSSLNLSQILLKGYRTLVRISKLTFHQNKDFRRFLKLLSLVKVCFKLDLRTQLPQLLNEPHLNLVSKKFQKSLSALFLNEDMTSVIHSRIFLNLSSIILSERLNLLNPQAEKKLSPVMYNRMFISRKLENASLCILNSTIICRLARTNSFKQLAMTASLETLFTKMVLCENKFASHAPKLTFTLHFGCSIYEDTPFSEFSQYFNKRISNSVDISNKTPVNPNTELTHITKLSALKNLEGLNLELDFAKLDPQQFFAGLSLPSTINSLSIQFYNFPLHKFTEKDFLANSSFFNNLSKLTTLKHLGLLMTCDRYMVAAKPAIYKRNGLLLFKLIISAIQSPILESIKLHFPIRGVEDSNGELLTSIFSKPIKELDLRVSIMRPMTNFQAMIQKNKTIKSLKLYGSTFLFTVMPEEFRAGLDELTLSEENHSTAHLVKILELLKSIKPRNLNIDMRGQVQEDLEMKVFSLLQERNFELCNAEKIIWNIPDIKFTQDQVKQLENQAVYNRVKKFELNPQKAESDYYLSFHTQCC